MIKEFNMYVYTRDIDFIGIIDFFSSLRWRRKYYEAGEFELHLPLDSQTIKYLKKDNLIIREDAVEVGIVESYTISDAGENGIDVTIYGRFLSSILDRRIIKNTINFRGNYLDGERELLKTMTPFSRLEVKDTSIESENVVFQCSYKNVSNYLTKLSKLSTIAHRITVDIPNKKYVYENYQGMDKTEMQSLNPRFEFSEDRANIDDANYTYSAKTEKNYALVGGQGEGKNRVLVEVKDKTYTDMDLREVFVDASAEVKEDTMSDADYKEILKTKGKENLLDVTETIEVTVYSDDYKKDDVSGWDLGDIVTIKKESWDVLMRQRIIEIEEVIEENNQKIYATFGMPFETSITDD